MTESQPVEPNKKKKGFDKYEVESACETLLRAEEIRNNEPLMKEVRKKLSAKKKAITSIAGLREKKAQVDMGEQGEEA